MKPSKKDSPNCKANGHGLASADGQSMSEDMLKQLKRVCKGDEITVTWAIRSSESEDYHRSVKEAKTIDYDMTRASARVKTLGSTNSTATPSKLFQFTALNVPQNSKRRWLPFQNGTQEILRAK